MQKTVTVRATIVAILAGLSMSAYAIADTQRIDIPAGSLLTALETLAKQANVDLVYQDAQVKGLQTGGVTGELSPHDAVVKLLQGTPLRVRRDEASGAILIAIPVPPAPAASLSPTGRATVGEGSTSATEKKKSFWSLLRLAQSDTPSTSQVDAQNPSPSKAEGQGEDAQRAQSPKVTELEEIVVTGSHIRGAPPASPLIVVTAQDMQNAGQYDLGVVIRSLPQNFGGGTNPTAGNRAATGLATNDSAGGASTLNLRGLGNDASLTLLNGRRLATNSFSGSDITAIPSAAVERLEILTDGGSALYGSDAVGGVANVITKRRYDGLTGTALYGDSTDGGFEQQQYSVSGGKSWSSGGLVAAAAWTRNTEISADQRSYARTMNRETTLLPETDRLNVFASLNQDLTSRMRVGLDSLYSRTKATSKLPYGTGPVISSGGITETKSESYLLAPNLRFNLPQGWILDAYATFGGDENPGVNTGYAAGVAVASQSFFGVYDNTSRSVEVSLNGSSFRLAAGSVGLAVGGGYRSNKSHVLALFGGAPFLDYSGTDTTRYAFGEVNVPLVSAAQDIPFVDRLNFSAALRYEDYNTVGSVSTPKFGVIYGVTPSWTLRGSWGQSFKVSPFYQRYQGTSAFLGTVTCCATQFPPGSRFISIDGSNPDLKPERANSTTISLEFNPVALPGLQLSTSYYHIDFKDRVVSPIPSSNGALASSTYASFITLNPGVAQQAAAIALSPTGLLNSTDTPYDPATVVAIIDSRLANATKQIAEGVDFSGSYTFQWGGNQQLTFSTSSTYLDIAQQLLPTLPALGLTGNAFLPRHFISRGGVSWQHGDLTLSGYGNYTSGAKYRSVTPSLDVASTTTVDLIARWTTPQPFGAVLELSVMNAFNDKPSVIPGEALWQTSYDATAYSVTGRFVSISLSRSF